MDKKTYSQAGQDLFVMNILNYIKNGYFIDIGCNDPDIGNNTRLLEDFDWKGISFDFYEIRNFSQLRNCKFILGDATKHDYNFIFESNGVPKVIDYLSIDIDALSLVALKKIPLSEYECKIITIEHDWYWYGNVLRSGQRQILSDLGYFLLCSDVGGIKPDKSVVFFEDWWIHPKHIDINKFINIKCDKLCYKDILSKFH